MNRRPYPVDSPIRKCRIWPSELRQLEHRLEPVVGRIRAERREPVQGHPAPDRVEPRLAESAARPRCWRHARQRAEASVRRPEALDLLPRELRVAIGAREMGHQSRPRPARRGQLRSAPSGPCPCRASGGPEPLRDLARPPRSPRAAPRAPRGAVDRRAEHDDPGGRDGRRRSATRFRHGGDAERLGPTLESRLGRLGRAVAVAVGLTTAHSSAPRARGRVAADVAANSAPRSTSTRSGRLTARPPAARTRARPDCVSRTHASSRGSTNPTRPSRSSSSARASKRAGGVVRARLFQPDGGQRPGTVRRPREERDRAQRALLVRVEPLPACLELGARLSSRVRASARIHASSSAVAPVRRLLPEPVCEQHRALRVALARSRSGR